MQRVMAPYQLSRQGSAKCGEAAFHTRVRHFQPKGAPPPLPSTSYRSSAHSSNNAARVGSAAESAAPSGSTDHDRPRFARFLGNESAEDEEVELSPVSSSDVDDSPVLLEDELATFCISLSQQAEEDPALDGQLVVLLDLYLRLVQQVGVEGVFSNEGCFAAGALPASPRSARPQMPHELPVYIRVHLQQGLSLPPSV